MRWLTPSLLALSLAFSTGGVAIVGRADSSAPPRAASGNPGSDLPSQCTPPIPAPRADQAATSRPREAGPEAANESIVLNTSGYNYSLQGEWHPDPAASPQGVPAGVLPRDLEAK